MIIHIVEQGETIYSIAEKYGVSAERITMENRIRFPNSLAIGEALVVLIPDISHVVQEGDTLGSIAAAYEVDVMQLLRNNPYLSEREFIFPGETIVVKYLDQKISKISVNGYAYPFIDLDVLRETLPFLTYLSIFAHLFSSNGDLIPINDGELIRLAREYGVAPIMLVSPIESEGITKTDTVHMLLKDEAAMEKLINNIIVTAKSKNYYGVCIDTVFVLWDDRESFALFTERMVAELKREGLVVLQTFSPTPFGLITGIIYESIDYARLGRAVDAAVILSYDWGRDIGIPTGTLTREQLMNFLIYAINQIPPMKTSLGFSVIGYNWKMPYIEGVTVGQSVNYNDVIELAHEIGVAIKYDAITMISYYQYVIENENIMRFRDARYFDTITNLVPEYGFGGIAVWNIMRFFTQVWLIINDKFEIDKIL